MGPQSTNPFRNMMNQLVMEQGRQRQQMPGFMQVDPNVAQLNDVMQMMDKTWGDSRLRLLGTAIAHEQMMRERVMMEQAFVESKLMEEEALRRHEVMNHQWKAEMEMQMAQAWGSDFIQNEVLDSKREVLEGAFAQAEQKVNAEVAEGMESTGNLMSLMMNDPDPRFRTSKFLGFLHKVKTGEYELDTASNQLVEHPEKHVEMQIPTDQFDLAYHAAATADNQREEEISESRFL
jgi:hypothetical protein